VQVMGCRWPTSAAEGMQSGLRTGAGVSLFFYAASLKDRNTGLLTMKSSIRQGAQVSPSHIPSASAHYGERRAGIVPASDSRDHRVPWRAMALAGDRGRGSAAPRGAYERRSQ
jgi:hypothetical protein